MGTEFYWDEKKERFLMKRVGNDCDGRELIFVFHGVQDLIEFLTADRERLIYDEYDRVWTVDSVRHQVLNEGAIIIDPEWW